MENKLISEGFSKVSDADFRKQIGQQKELQVKIDEDKGIIYLNKLEMEVDIFQSIISIKDFNERLQKGVSIYSLFN